jgi:3-oxoacyl-[acyl-carrier-protein] synthase-3
MRYSNVAIAGLGYELAPNVVTSEDLEKRLTPLYEKLHLHPGQLEALTGITERRFWDLDFRLSDGAIQAGRKALSAAGVAPNEIGMLIYGSVCRENLEPATACAVAHGLGIGPDAQVYDVSNACIGELNGIIQIANAIELGQLRAGIVVACESSRQIVETTIQRLLHLQNINVIRDTIATLTGGSGAIGIVLTDRSMRKDSHRLLGGVCRNATQHHHLCTWGPDTGIPSNVHHVMKTDSVNILKHGVALGAETFDYFRQELSWGKDKPDKIICHQVGAPQQRAILAAIGIDEAKDFSTYRYLGNIGTVSLPVSAAIADERQFLRRGDSVAFLATGSGLNCLMLGLEW